MKKEELIRFYKGVDLKEPFVMSAYAIDYKYLSLEISDNELKIRFMPFVFAYFKELQCISCTDNYNNTGEYREFLTCFFDIYQDNQKKEDCNENWNIIVEFLSKNKNQNSDISQFNNWILKNKNEITSFNVDFVKKKLI